MNIIRLILLGSTLAVPMALAPPALAADAEHRASIERGRYIARTAGSG
jgi:hypothetical protein